MEMTSDVGRRQAPTVISFHDVGKSEILIYHLKDVGKEKFCHDTSILSADIRSRNDNKAPDAEMEVEFCSAHKPGNGSNIVVRLEPAAAHGSRSLDPNSFGDYCRGADPR